MKKLIFAFALCMPMLCKSQTNEAIQLQIDSIKHQMKASGRELIKFKSQMMLGIGMEVAGTALTLVGLQVDEATGDGDGNVIMIVGGAMSLAGIITNILSYHHVSLAGAYMKNNALTYDLPIKRRNVIK